tara:strand:+ start:974 stop:1396 length:423 start_codon:yes stop_codon:yes gene_type:complete
MKTECEFDISDVLTKPLFAHLATTSPDGPRESPIWFLWEDNALWFVSTTASSFPKRIQNDSRCAVGIIDFDANARHLLHVGFRGNATLAELDNDRLERLLHRYIGTPTEWDNDFKKNIIDNLDLMIKFTPTSIVARDQSY